MGASPFEVYKQLAVQQHIVVLDEEEAKEEAAAAAMLAAGDPSPPAPPEPEDEDDVDYDSDEDKGKRKKGKAQIAHAEVLSALPDLSIVAGITRFGLADVTLLQAIEVHMRGACEDSTFHCCFTPPQQLVRQGLDGSDEIPGYKYVEEHSSWEIWANKLLRQIAKDQKVGLGCHDDVQHVAIAQDVMNALRNVKRPASKSSPSSKKRKVCARRVLVLGDATPLHRETMRTWASTRRAKRSRQAAHGKRTGRQSNGCVRNALQATWMVPTGMMPRTRDCCSIVPSVCAHSILSVTCDYLSVRDVKLLPRYAKNRMRCKRV